MRKMQCFITVNILSVNTVIDFACVYGHRESCGI